MRLHELAKEIGAESKALLALAKGLGLNVRNHSSNLAAGEVAILKAAYREEFGDSAPAVAEVVEEDTVASDAASAAPRRRRRRPATGGDAPEGDHADGGDVDVDDVESYDDGESFDEAAEGDGYLSGESGGQADVGDTSPAVAAQAEDAAQPVSAVHEQPPAQPDRDTGVTVAPPQTDEPKPQPGAADSAAPHAPRTRAEEVSPPLISSSPQSAPDRNTPKESPPRPSDRGQPQRAPDRGQPQRPPERGQPQRPPERGQPQRPPERGQPQRPPERGQPQRPPERGQPQRPAARQQQTPSDAGSGAKAPMQPDKRTPRPVTGKPEQTPTVRPRTGGARILGRIELPPEEKNRVRTRTTPEPSGGVTSPADLEALEHGRARPGPSTETPASREIERRKAGAVRGKDETVAWSPDDEDDPLLQGIRVRHAAMGPHTRRPPRRVGPRRAGRRPPPVVRTGPIEVPCPVSVRDLSQLLGEKANDILRILLGKGHVAHVNMALGEEAILEVATALNREVSINTTMGREDVFLAEVEASDKKRVEGGDAGRALRPPVVAFLGHVDHGKTSLLDRIRKSDVAAGEAGGITQSMRAYSVQSPAGGSITLLDTPGHKAFTEMRARGANVTDIVVLVVAADDGVMPQTQEAIQHARAADVAIVVAINKVDRPEARIDRVLQQLAQEGVMVEGWGGEVQYAAVSAVTGQGIDELLEKISLQAEIMDLRANPDQPARGTVLEARKDDQLGAVATVLIQEGTLRVGDVALSGTSFGRVRKLIDDQGRDISSAGPATPVNVVGLNAAPNASATIFVLEDLRQARQVAEERLHAERQERVGGPAPTGQITLENLFATLEAGKAEEIKIVLRCDVKGSLEVVRRSLLDLEQKEVRVKIIREALGGITEDDVLLAMASQAIVIGFNVVADDKARIVAEAKAVDVRTYQIIYELIDQVKAAMEGLLSPIKREQVVGHVEIREVFKVSRLGNIAGCRVQDGVVRRNSVVRLTRDGRIIHTGTLESLRRIKDDVREVKEGLECGLKLANYDDIKVGDVLEVIEVAEERRTLDFAKS